MMIDTTISNHRTTAKNYDPTSKDEVTGLT